MTSSFLERQVQRLLSQAEEALDKGNWTAVREAGAKILALDPANADAPALVAAADRALGGEGIHHRGTEGAEERREDEVDPGVGATATPRPPKATGKGRGGIEGHSAADAGKGDPDASGRSPLQQAAAAPVLPTSFANGRYTVKRFLGEGGKKKVYRSEEHTSELQSQR